MPRPTYCYACGQDQGVIDAHAEDYSEPFGPHIQEFWLCYVCHLMVHCRFKNPSRWEAYKRMVAQGYRAATFVTRNWFRFLSLYLKSQTFPGEAFVLATPPERLVLEAIAPTHASTGPPLPTIEDGLALYTVMPAPGAAEGENAPGIAPQSVSKNILADTSGIHAGTFGTETLPVQSAGPRSGDSDGTAVAD